MRGASPGGRARVGMTEEEDAVSVSIRPLTYEDLVAIPEDGKRYEVIGGSWLCRRRRRRSIRGCRTG